VGVLACAICDKTFILNIHEFDNRGNFEFDSGETFYYGPHNEPYYQPSKPWKRIGLNILQYYKNRDDRIWFGTDKNAWPVAYHGFRCKEISALANIIQCGFKIGQN
jgi:hypothetical protein